MAEPLTQLSQIIEVIYEGRNAGQTCLTVLHYRISEQVEPVPYSTFYEDLNEIFKESSATILTAYTGCMSEDYILDFVRYQCIAPVRYLAQRFATAISSGTVVGAVCPPGVSGAITKRGWVSDRHNIGGIRMPGVPFDWVSEGRLTSGGVAEYLTLANAIAVPRETDSGVQITPCLLNKAEPLASAQVDFAFPQDTIRTMSRRVVGRGI